MLYKLRSAVCKDIDNFSRCFLQGPDRGLDFLALPAGACDVLVPSRVLASEVFRSGRWFTSTHSFVSEMYSWCALDISWCIQEHSWTSGMCFTVQWDAWDAGDSWALGERGLADWGFPGVASGKPVAPRLCSNYKMRIWNSSELSCPPCSNSPVEAVGGSQCIGRFASASRMGWFGIFGPM